MRKTLCSLIIFLFVGCQEYSLQINKAGEFRFRRSYADIQFREMPSNEIDSIRFSNPVIEWESFSNKEIALLYELREAGVLDPIYDLNRSKFPDTASKKLTLIHEDGSPVEVAFYTQQVKTLICMILSLQTSTTKRISEWKGITKP